MYLGVIFWLFIGPAKIRLARAVLLSAPFCYLSIVLVQATCQPLPAASLDLLTLIPGLPALAMQIGRL